MLKRATILVRPSMRGASEPKLVGRGDVAIYKGLIGLQNFGGRVKTLQLQSLTSIVFLNLLNNPLLRLEAQVLVRRFAT